jgi:uncharacterized cupredoxin-like copper-binding protein
MRRMLVIPSLVAALAAVPLLPHAGRGAAPTVRLAAKEFLFVPKEISATSGHVTFVVQNQGSIEHDLVVAGAGGNTVAQIAIIEPGETGTLDATLPPGTYTLYCNLPGHREAGMVATLRVNP